MMSDATVQVKTSTPRDFEEALLSGSLDRAQAVQRDLSLSDAEAGAVAEKSFATLMERRDYRRAVELAGRYALDPQRAQDAKIRQFALCVAGGEYDQAAEWAREHALPPPLILPILIQTLEQKTGDNGSRRVEAPAAVPPREMDKVGASVVNGLIQRGQAYGAAVLGQVLQLPLPVVLPAAARAFLELGRQDDWARIPPLIQDFGLFSDSVYPQLSDEDRQAIGVLLVEEGIGRNLRRGRIDPALHLLESTELLTREHGEGVLQELAGEALMALANHHHRVLLTGRVDDAVSLMTRFDLLHDRMPARVRTKVIDSAQIYFTKLMKKLDADGAKQLTEAYGLFKDHVVADSDQVRREAVTAFLERALGEGAVTLATHIISEYPVSDEAVAEAASRACADLFAARKFDEAFECLDAFQFDPTRDPVESEARRQFDEALHEERFPIAAEIGLRCRLDRKATEHATLVAWQHHMNYARYDEAKAARIRYNLPINRLRPFARKVYQYNLSRGDVGAAIRLRREYGIRVGLWSLILEWLRQIFLRWV